MDETYRTPTGKELDARDYAIFREKVEEFAKINMYRPLGRYLAVCCHDENDDRNKVREPGRDPINGVRKFFNNIRFYDTEHIQDSNFQDEAKKRKLDKSIETILNTVLPKLKEIPSDNSYYAVLNVIEQTYKGCGGYEGIGKVVVDAVNGAEDFDSFDKLLRKNLLSS